MERNLALEVVRATEAAALAAARFIGKGDERMADRAALTDAVDGSPGPGFQPGVPKRATIQAGPMYFSWPGRACLVTMVWLPTGLARENSSKT